MTGLLSMELVRKLVNLLVVATIILGLPFLFSTTASGSDFGNEEFSEELLLKPLPDRKVLSHFYFQSKAPLSESYGHHHHLFPKAIAQLVQKFHLKEMELSFTQGRWNYESWGGSDPISSTNAKPPGVELWAVFDVPQDQVDASWRNLTNSLSGLFCASINFLESPTSYTAPEWVFKSASGSLRYGMLPREAVCTENLTPWLKLLPCRDKAGLASLMDRPSIYRGFYHSQRLRLTTYSDSKGHDSGTILDQTLTVVLPPNDQKTRITYSNNANVQPNWYLSTIFGRKLSGRCIPSKSSNIYLQLEDSLVSALENLHANAISWENNVSLSRSNSMFELSVYPDRVHRPVNNLNNEQSTILYEYSIKYNESEPFDLGLTWRSPVLWNIMDSPLHANRFLMGSGNERGSIAIFLKSTELSKVFLTSSTEKECKFQVDIFQVVPWYIKVYYHSLRLYVDNEPQALTDFVERMHISPSEDKASPGVMELLLKFPCDIKSAALTLEFDKGFLHIDEYPPDANQGFDIPSAMISFPNFHAGMRFPYTVTLSNSPMLSKFREESPILLYTEVLLVPLTTPDFSMPYNVITITCTVFALYFGSMLNVLRRRVGEEERLLKRKADVRTSLLSKLLSKFSTRLGGRQSKAPEATSRSSFFIGRKLIVKVILITGIALLLQATLPDGGYMDTAIEYIPQNRIT